ncbi:helix-turn-helix domain-containing protein [Aquaspirillum soli]
MDTFGDRVRARRTELGMTQGTLAKAVGMKSQSGIGNIESGRNDGSRFLLELAKALKVRPLWLQYGQGEKEAPVVETISQEQENPPPNLCIISSSEDEEKRIIEAYRNALPEEQEVIKTILFKEGASSGWLSPLIALSLTGIIQQAKSWLETKVNQNARSA